MLRRPWTRLLSRRPAPGGEARADLRYLFVVTYGRSGSTLVQGLLNTLPGTLVRGENNLYVLPLFRAKALAESHRRRYGRARSQKVSSAFYGLHALEPDLFVSSARELVIRQLLGSVDPASVRVLGFKEVLWHRVQRRETEAFFTFLDECFPGAMYVLNHRDHDHVAGSGFWQKQEQEEALRAITRVERIQDHLRRTRPERVLDTRYELLTHHDRSVVDEHLRGLAEFVTGSCSESQLEALRHTLTRAHGPRPFGASKRAQADPDQGPAEPAPRR